MKTLTKFRYPLQIHLLTLFILLVILVGGIVGGFSYTSLRDLIEARARATSKLVTNNLDANLKSLIIPAKVTVNLLGTSSITEAVNLKERLKRVGIFKEALKGSDLLASIYIGYDTGDFFLLRDISNEAQRVQFQAPINSHFLVQSIERSFSPPRGRFLYLDEHLNVLQEENRPDYFKEFDPRKRNWYMGAMKSLDAIVTSHYQFFSDQRIGGTIAKQSDDGHSVIGTDIPLENLNEILAKQIITPSSKLLLTDGQGYVIAYNKVAQLGIMSPNVVSGYALKNIDDIQVPALTGLGSLIRGLQGSDPYLLKVNAEGVDWRVTIQPMAVEGAPPMFLVSAIPAHELLAAAYKLLTSSVWIMVAIILLMIPIVYLIARAISKSLRLLRKEAESIQRFEFSQPIQVDSMILEVDEVAKTMHKMKSTIRRFLDTSSLISSEKDFDRLLPILLSEIISISESEAGILYLLDNDQFIPVSALCGNGNEFLELLYPLPLGKVASILGDAINESQPIIREMTGELIDLDRLKSIIQSTQCIVVPLLNREKNLLGVMLLSHQQAVDKNQLAFIKALTDASTISLQARELIKSQKELFEAFIKLWAGAIDAKSPYTGGHCKRVPVLTEMLVRAVCENKSGPYADFELSEQEWEAVHMAAWLHDCGKIVTPVDVVDKATKLEMIYDRIHEVRMRFEVLKCNAEIECLKKIASGEEEAMAREFMVTEHRQLDDDFAFIASCNEGGEFMSQDKIDRLKSIANKTWVRTIDNRQGISQNELSRMEGNTESLLPVTEQLLADKPEHRFLRTENDRMPKNNPWGFNMPEPDLLYNKGELYNLSVGRGTLSAEERYKINEHMTQTIMMLTALPFPRHLRAVPEIAGGHHETLIGTGYPKKLSKENLPPVTRMMAIADIFEALTAQDRPYKKPKTVSESIKIMSFMKEAKHIDAGLFDLFLQSGVYLEYAKQYLNPEQIDEVHIEKYLG